ncbi:MAG: multiheme c-type cytochrome [Roseibacillus sp.]
MKITIAIVTLGLLGNVMPSAFGQAASTLHPEMVVGNAACAECHEEEVKAWTLSSHKRADSVHRDAKTRAAADKIAKAMGLASGAAMTKSALCTECHFTRQKVGGALKVIGGVSCESCHGGAKDFQKIHGEKEEIPSREISYLFGQYKRLKNRFTGILTGKGLAFGGSCGRREATGYGCVYFCESMFQHRGESIEGKRCLVSGSGNVAIYSIEKALEMGAKVLTFSDSSGFVFDPDGIDEEKLAFIKDLKEVRRGRVNEYAEKFGRAEFHAGQNPWSVPAEIALPCATQNEISEEDAQSLIKNGVQAVCEGANMPTALEGVHAFLKARILFGPAKAANAGGVAVSGLEQSQNALRISWDHEEVDRRLKAIMRDIHSKCVEHGRDGDQFVNYVDGANIAGFLKVAEAMLAYGAV